MRFLWAGLFLLLSASGALAQATGSVVSLGFGGNYRPDCWTPLVVELNSTLEQPATYQIRVQQQDLDKDTVVYTRTVTVNPKARQQRFWVYFMPQTTDKGLPGPTSPNIQLKDVLKVNLFDKAGGTLVANLPLAPAVQALDVEADAKSRGVKVVLVVRSTGSARWSEYNNAQGVIEDAAFVDVTPDRLPDHLIGYAAVDAVLWLDAKVTDIKGTSAFTALQDWVRRGGNLAVCHPSDRSQLEAFDNADMLPVTVRAGEAWTVRTDQKADLQHVLKIAAEGMDGFPSENWAAFEKSGKSFEVARAPARPDAMVDAWVTWPDADDGSPTPATPFIARRAYGLGSVSWVAQDLGNSALLNVPPPPQPPLPPLPPGAPPRALPAPVQTTGWARVWDRVFGWRNQTRSAAELDKLVEIERQKRMEPRVRREYDREEGVGVDLGEAMARGMEHSARSATYVFVAVLFFIGYWVVAGPGSYLYLAARKKKGLSWGIFGAAALLATVVTVVVVKLLLSGGTEVRHVSVVRLVPEAPAADGSARFSATVSSRMGLYIPRDGPQHVTVAPPAAERSAWVTPFGVPPKWVNADAGFTDTARYVVDTDPILASGTPGVDFFLRSTLKKVHAQWTGSVAEGIVGAPELLPDQNKMIGGLLVNTTGRKLTHVYFVFTYGPKDANAKRLVAADRFLYLPEWPDKKTIDLAVEHAAASSLSDNRTPGSGDEVKGFLDPVNGGSWTNFLYRDLGGRTESFDDRDKGYARSFPLMALIDRVGPFRQISSSGEKRRVEPVRRGGREFDVSQLVASGKLVILAQAAGSPVPAPVIVNGERVAGEGVTFYEVALPLSRQKLEPQPVTRPATTRAATGPATAPAKK